MKTIIVIILAVFTFTATKNQEQEWKISYLTVNAVCRTDGIIEHPDLRVVINEDEYFTLLYNGCDYSQMLIHEESGITSVTIYPILKGEKKLFIKDVRLNDLKLNSPEGWNVSIEEGIEWLGNTYFLMPVYSVIKFEKPKKII